MNKLLLLITCCMPLKQLVLTSAYGYRIHPLTGHVRFHSGIDLRARRDTVFAVIPGQINGVHDDPALGVYIILECGDLRVMFGHLSQVFVRPGDPVSAGAPIAITGSSGRVTGEHLHFSISYRKKHLNPLHFMYALLNNLNKNK